MDVNNWLNSANFPYLNFHYHALRYIYCIFFCLLFYFSRFAIGCSSSLKAYSTIVPLWHFDNIKYVRYSVRDKDTSESITNHIFEEFTQTADLS